MTEEKKTTTRIPSEALFQKINDIVGSFGRTRDKVLEAIELGRKEGFTDMQIGNMIREAMIKAGYCQNWIRHLLPETAKRVYPPRKGEEMISAISKEKWRSREKMARRRIIIKNLKPQDYRSHELEGYSKVFLIAIIKWYEEKEAIVQQKQAELQTLLQPINKRRIVSTDGGPPIK